MWQKLRGGVRHARFGRQRDKRRGEEKTDCGEERWRKRRMWRENRGNHEERPECRGDETRDLIREVVRSEDWRGKGEENFVESDGMKGLCTIHTFACSWTLAKFVWLVNFSVFAMQMTCDWLNKWTGAHIYCIFGSLWCINFINRQSFVWGS